MTEDKANEIIHSFVMSDHFDDLMVYRLEKSLEWTLDQLNYDYDHNDMFNDLKYCRSLIGVLQAFSLNDYQAETKILNSIQDKLLSNYF
jgi:DNA recombination-dependent growth factor C